MTAICTEIQNRKLQITNTKWFDKLTTLSQVEGQITMINPPPADETCPSFF
jgi:hypothetical protein